MTTIAAPQRLNWGEALPALCCFSTAATLPAWLILYGLSLSGLVLLTFAVLIQLLGLVFGIYGAALTGYRHIRHLSFVAIGLNLVAWLPFLVALGNGTKSF